MNEVEHRVTDALAARTRSVVAGPTRLEAALRRRRRRDRAVAGGMALLAAAGAVTTLVFLRGPSSTTSLVPAGSPTAPAPGPTQPLVSTPSAVASAVLPTGPVTHPRSSLPVGTVPLGAYGLAALADPGAEVLDATGGRTALLAPASTAAAAFAVSADGRYVAAHVGADQATVEVLDRDDHVVWSGRADTGSWSPVSDTLALDGPSGVQLLRVEAGRASVQDVGARTTYALGIAWRPDGSELAVGSDAGLRLFAVSGRLLDTVTGPRDVFLVPVAWTSDSAHLLLFRETDSSSLDADGVDAVAAAVHGGRITLGATLGQGVPQSAWWHPTGGADVLGTLGGGRDVADDKRVVRCDLAAQRCTTLAGDARTSAFAAVPTAAGIAYLMTPASPDGYSGASTGYVLTLADDDGGSAHPAPGAPATLEVLADGDTLLLDGRSGDRSGIFRYAAGETIRLTTTAGPDADPEDLSDYYGQDTEIVAWRPAAR